MERRLRLAALALAAGLAGACQEPDLSPRPAPGQIALYDDLFSVSVPDPDHAVAVGYYGAAYTTSDGGVTWQKGDTGTLRPLFSVSMADARAGWAVGQQGTILRTEDGGATWTSQPNPKQEEGSHLFGVHAIDRQSAWAVGEWGTRLRTRDGGASWQDHSLTVDPLHPQFVWLSAPEQATVRRGGKVYEDVGLNDIVCLPPPQTACWIVGEFGTVFRSDDRGAHWERGEILGQVRLDPIVLPYDGIEIRAEDRARILAFAARIADRDPAKVRIDPFASPKEIATLGRADDPSALFDLLEARTDEMRALLEEAGISSDRLRTPNPPPWDFEDFLEEDPTSLERYLDGRRAEEPMIRVGLIQNPHLFDAHFDGALRGLVSGLGGVVLRSEDGGRSWRTHATDRKQALFAVATADGRALAVGEQGLVRLSEDGGRSWRAPREGEFPPVFSFLRDMAFDPTGLVGLIVGQTGTVLRSTDSGATWTQVLPPASAEGARSEPQASGVHPASAEGARSEPQASGVHPASAEGARRRS